MCKWIKDILFPTNVLGKKKDSFEIKIENPPYTSRTFNIEWTGERLDIAYTKQTRRGRVYFKEPIRLQYLDGNETEEEFTVAQSVIYQGRIWTDNVYFNCTNVTSLIVNGEQLI